MKKNLAKSIPQCFNGVEKTITVTVDYNTETEEIEIVSVVVDEHKYWQEGNTVHHSALSTVIDITDLIIENFPGFETDVKTMDWSTELEESKYVEEAA